MISFYLSQYPEENVVIKALYEGCVEEKELTFFDDYTPSDVAVVMGVYKKYVPASFPRGKVIAEQKRRSLDCLILETGYINRGRGESNHYALGWNGLNGRADFRNKNSPTSRAEKLGVKIKPHKDGGHILLCGQVPWDASCDFTDHHKWLQETINKISERSDRRIVFRPHPLGKLPPLEGCEYSVRKTIEEDLDGAHCHISFNSNTGVDAALAGVPTFAFDMGSMVWGICNKDLDRLESPRIPSVGEAWRWACDLAYAQWTPEEMRCGDAWLHIGNRASTAIPEAQL